MNRKIASLIVAGCSALLATDAHGQKLSWSKRLTIEDVRCLNELIRGSHYTDVTADERHKLARTVRVSHTDLNGSRRKNYIYLFDNIGWCGSAGCTVLIGERWADRLCHLLYSGSGWFTATLLSQRDHRGRAPNGYDAENLALASAISICPIVVLALDDSSRSIPRRENEPQPGKRAGPAGYGGRPRLYLR
jgi:hypothetical protein